MVEFSEVKSCELFDLFKSVNKCISVNEQLSRCFGNVQIVLEETLDSEQCFVVERLDRAFLENFLEEGFAECCREVVDKSCDTEVIVGNDRLVRIENLADFKCDLSFLERTRKILDADNDRADTDIYPCVEFARKRIGN